MTEKRGGLHYTGEGLTFPVSRAGGVENVGVDDRDAGGGLFDAPVEGVPAFAYWSAFTIRSVVSGPGETTSITRSTCSGRVGVRTMASAR